MTSSLLKAQPDWTVIPSDFEFTMTVIGIAMIDCEESIDDQDIIAAFINGEVRGVQPMNTVIAGRRYAFMLVYENEFEGQEISFQMYDASSDSIFNVGQTLLFMENKIVGSEIDPYVFNSIGTITKTFLSRDSIHEIVSEGSVIANLQSVVDHEDTLSLEYALVDDALGIDNHHFTLSGSELISKQNLDPHSKATYQINIQTYQQNYCEREDTFIIHLEGGNITSVQEIFRSEEEILFYPNPASDIIHFTYPSKIKKMHIYSSDGNQVNSFIYTGEFADISTLIPGMYLIHIITDTKTEIRKLIIH